MLFNNVLVFACDHVCIPYFQFSTQSESHHHEKSLKFFNVLNLACAFLLQIHISQISKNEQCISRSLADSILLLHGSHPQPAPVFPLITVLEFNLNHQNTHPMLIPRTQYNKNPRLVFS